MCFEALGRRRIVPGLTSVIESLILTLNQGKVSARRLEPLVEISGEGEELGVGEALPFGVLAPAEGVRVAIPFRLLEKHLLLIGPTGCGKTVGIRNYQFTMLDSGRTVVNFGYRSNEANEAAACLIDRTFPIEKCTFYDFGNPNWVIPLNLLGKGPGDAFARAEIIYRALEAELDSPFGVQISLDLRVALVCCAALGLSLLEVEMLLAPEGETLRNAALARVEDEYTREQLARYASLTAEAMHQRVAGVSNKLAKFLYHPDLRRSLGADGAIDFSHLLDVPGHFSQIALSCDTQPTARVLGRMLLSTCQLRVMSRVGQPEEIRNPVSVVVDEFSRLADPSAGILLEEARKCRCTLVVAFQQATQVSRELYHSLTTNCATQFFYQTPGSEVASLASEIVSSLSRDEIKRQMLLLPVGCALLLRRGQPAPWYRLRTFQFPEFRKTGSQSSRRKRDRNARKHLSRLIRK